MRFEIGYDEVKKAFWTWFNYHDMTYGSAVKSFYSFTGIGSFLNQHHVVTEEQYHRIKLLAGPHGRTLLAAHYAASKG